MHREARKEKGPSVKSLPGQIPKETLSPRTLSPGRLLSTLLRIPIHLYRGLISPWKPRTCRFHPSCSRYALEALEMHGPMKGILLIAWRLLRCQPFAKGGEDPVPPRKKNNASS